MTRRFLLPFVCFALAQCGDAGGPGETPPALNASIVEVIQGDGQTDTVGRQLPVPIRIVVLDTTVAAGSAGWSGVAGPPTPVPGQLVNFVVVSGGGSVFAGAALTDSAGHAQELWTLGGAAGAQCLEARAVDQETGQPITFAQVCATAVPGPMTAAGFSIDSARVFGDTTFLVPAFARDAFNNPLPLPTIANLDSGVTLTPEGASYRVAFQRAGLTRLALNGDTLYLYAWHPRGPFRWVRHRGDTTWTETGGLRALPVSGSLTVGCPANANVPVANVRELAADGRWLVRSVAGGAVDTLIANESTGSAQRGCSIVENGDTGPLRPKPEPEWSAWYTIGAIGGPPPGQTFSNTLLAGAFTYVKVNADIVDTLWLGQP